MWGPEEARGRGGEPAQAGGRHFVGGLGRQGEAKVSVNLKLFMHWGEWSVHVKVHWHQWAMNG